MSDRGPVTRCRIRGCPFLGHFAAYGGRCPMHREDDRIDRYLTPETEGR